MSDHHSSIFGVGHIQNSLGLVAAPTPQQLRERYRPKTLRNYPRTAGTRFA